ncbi:Retrovirus-related Pol polyprotein from type-1 retrotransposable element R2, partial [Smittium culicis]
YSGRFLSSLIDGPIFDKNRKLVTGHEEKSEAWAAHFEELAKDSTGNSRSAEKWSNMGLGSEAVYTECDVILTWTEICAALKSTPNNKSPGSDGIPREENQWAQYLDWVHRIAKAYDRVPHQALLRKIKTAGIGGKLYRMIEALCRSSKMCVRVGDRLSKIVEYNCGVRHGSPASPLLFDIFINDLLDGIKGVKIPGIGAEVPGLLFAEDAVVLAESPAELQIALEKLSAWSLKWEMQINQEKCGIMGINSSARMLFTFMGKPIEQVT